MITLITTTRDNADEISRTLASLVDQDCRLFEWLIYDGSRNTPIDAFRAFANIAKESGISARVVHAHDTSIYSAMQNSLEHTERDWCLFLNCGDMLCHPNTISHLSDFLTQPYDVIYGGNIFINVDQTVHYHPGASPEQIRSSLESGDTPYYHHMVCQQSIAYRVSLLSSSPLYPVELRLAADHNHFLRTIHSKQNIRYIKMPISIYFGGGASYKYVLNTYAEWMYNNIKFLGCDADINLILDHYLGLIASHLGSDSNA